MSSQIILSNKVLNYTDQGKGIAVVLLHGYLESVEIWKDFANDLSKNYRVICIDIPGHGNSELLSEKHSMEELAKRINDFFVELKIEKCVMIGHSMGGYITLMFHKLFPEKLSGFSLFHSQPFTDINETKKKRLREINLVNDGKKDLIAKFNIPNAFADINLIKFKDSIKTATEIAIKTSDKGIIANLFAMMNRPDLSKSLKNSKIPFLYILGKEDNYIDYSSIVSKIELPENSELIKLENSGHMGFIEEKEKSVEIVSQFLDK